MASTTLRAFVREIASSWFTLMSGGLSVPACALGVYASNVWAQIGFAITAFVCVWGAAYRIWARERGVRIALEEKLKPVGLNIKLSDIQPIDGNFPHPLRRTVLLSVKNNSGNLVSECYLKGRYSEEDELFSTQVSEPFRLLVDDQKEICALYFDVEQDRHILMPSFSSKYKDWQKTGRIFENDEDHEFIFQTISTSQRSAALKILAKFENGQWVFSDKKDG